MSSIILREEQQRAKEAKSNVIVSAGAGSGKTFVLASRFVYLVIERGLKVDEILTLTFTNKATNEMYERIYKMLSLQKSNERAKEALDNFYKVRIQTLDSFCADIAKTGAYCFGISPEFKSDDWSIKELAKEAALSFVLDNRENVSLQRIIADKKIQTVSEQLFAETVLKYSPISRPLDFDKILDLQIKMIKEDWNVLKQSIIQLLDKVLCLFKDLLKKENGPFSNAKEGEGYKKLSANKDFIDFKKFLEDNKMPDLPSLNEILESNNIVETEKLISFNNFLQKVASLKNLTVHAFVKEFNTARKEITEIYTKKIASIVNFTLQIETVRGIFELLKKFQNSFNKKKRLTGLLTFTDIAYLAVDILENEPEIRKIYKTEIKAIMVDEFQDNNELQRDLIFLLAENLDRTNKGLPQADELLPNKMFFVGDEKQSIYRFRGADVAVFRSLSTLLPKGADLIELKTNFRSKQSLINVFNYIFEIVFKAEQHEDYEADFKALECGRNSTEGSRQDVHFCFLQKDDNLENKKDGIDEYDLESAFIAEKIKNMVEENFSVLKKIENKDTLVPCQYDDIAILLRKKTHIRKLEKQLKSFGVPYSTDEPSALWTEAIINDITAYLKCLVYPGDKLSFAALLRSPFVRISDTNFALCMLKKNLRTFDESVILNFDNDGDKERYKKAKSFYLKIKDALKNDSLSIADTVTKLWYEAGYRYETILPEGSQKYSEIYDYFFEMCRRADLQGMNLAAFIDSLEQKKSPDSLEIPIEQKSGVKILTIHKSKGLEFPVVFVCFCGSQEKSSPEQGMIYYKKLKNLGVTRDLLTLNLPVAIDGDKPLNYFYQNYKNEDKKMALAEIKRLLYVAATRAESALFWTAAIPKPTQAEQKDTSFAEEENSLLKRIKIFSEKLLKSRIEKDGEGSVPNFLELLVTAIANTEDPLWELESIPNKNHGELAALASKHSKHTEKNSFAKKLKDAKNYYNEKTVEEIPTILTEHKNASKLDDKEKIYSHLENDKLENDKIDLFLKKVKLNHAEFGTIVHSVIEDRLNGCTKENYNTKKKLIRETAEKLAETFFSSLLGKKCLDAKWRKQEYAFVSLIENENKKTYIQGRIDLFFEYDDTVYLVDFKTDKEIQPNEYKQQILCYKDAIKNLYPQVKKIESYLFYLRYGRAELCSKED